MILVPLVLSAFNYGTPPRVRPTLTAPYAFENTVIHLRFGIPRGIVYGTETIVLRVKHAGTRELPFDSRGITYRSIVVNGAPARYTVDARRQMVLLHLAAAPAPAQRLTVQFSYVTAPKDGIFFVRPDASYPRITPEIWSQGEPAENRRWFPTWDEPNQKTPSELILDVPRGWTAVADGRLIARTPHGAVVSWDWKMREPTSTYLIAFAAGPLRKHHTSDRGMDVDSFVQPPLAALNAVCFGRTYRMVAYYEHLIGIRFPFEKYDQTTAERFIFGGMEDASATIQTALALHPAIEEPENSCDQLVSHELAQEWFGDDATMMDWSNLWLNEGFATYFDELWTAHSLGTPDFEYARYQAQQTYFEETRQYLRPIVDYDYSDPLDLFDASSHERPAEVIHMLRYLFGDRRFFAALHGYLRAYAYRNVDTAEFFSFMSRYFGTDLTWFEREWFFRSDYPHYVVHDEYDAPRKDLVLRVEQRNIGGLPYRMPIVVEVFLRNEVLRRQLDVTRNAQTFLIANVPERPRMVLFDPDNNILRRLTFPKSTADLVYQLSRAPHVADREWALAQLNRVAKRATTDGLIARNAIAMSASDDRFYGMRSDAVADAAAWNDVRAVDAGLHDDDKRVRIAALNAAAALPAGRAKIDADVEEMTADPDPVVAADALTALGALRAPGSFARLTAALERRSFRQTVASGALAGLALSGDAAALPLIERRCAYGTQEQERDAAVAALATLSKRTKTPETALKILLPILERDPLLSTRLAAAAALGALGDKRAIPALRRVHDSGVSRLLQMAAWNAISELSQPR